MNEDLSNEAEEVAEDFDEEDELGSEDLANQSYNDNPDAVDRKTVAKVLTSVNADGTLRKHVRARRSDFVRNLIYLDGNKFSFSGRDYLRPIYDRDDKQVMLKNARQTEKCGISTSCASKASGGEVMLKDLKCGDRVLGMNAKGFQVEEIVTASSSNGKQPCIRIKTRLGSELTITENHPLRKLQHWEHASNLRVGDKIASLRTQGMFGNLTREWSTLLGIYLGDGHFYKDKNYKDKGGGWTLGITKKNKIVRDLINEELSKCNFCCNDDYVDPRTGCTGYKFSVVGPWAEVLRNLGLADKRAHEKIIPEEVFSWDKKTTRELLRGLWCTDGHCKNIGSRVDLVYGSTSALMIRQIRLLLRKFGVITTQREYQPKGSNTHKHYLIRVITRRSIEAFYNEIGPIVSKPFFIPETCSNSNVDTLPKEIYDLITGIQKSRGDFWKRGSFTTQGLRMSKAYCPTFSKVERINRYLNDESLHHILSSDIIWDEIISVEDAGIQDTWAVETATSTYISDFIVNHNTTFLANNLVATSVVMPYNKALYVSPSHTQTRQFSNEKLRPAIEKSPHVKRYFQDSSVSTQVFEKGFTNGSYIFLRSAFRSADRCLAEGTKVTLYSGEVRSIECLEPGDTVLSYDGVTAAAGEVVGKLFNGEKPTLVMTLESGHTIIGSTNHRFLTQDGLKHFDEITTEDFIPAPLNYLKNEGVLDNINLWAGLLLGDGCVAKRSKKDYHRNFNNNSLELIEIFEEKSRQLGFTTKRSQRVQGGKLNYTAEICEKNEAEALFRSWGILGKGQFDKFIPEQFFKTRSSISAVLLGLFESNGWTTFNLKSRQSEVGFVTGSVQMADDVQRGLQSLGVYSTISVRDPKEGGKQRHRWYTVKIRNSSHIKIFHKVVGFFSRDKREKFEECLHFLDSLLGTSARELDVPARKDCSEVLLKKGISTHELWKKHGISFRFNAKTGPCVAQHKVRVIQEITGDNSLDRWLNPDIAWIPVSKIVSGPIRRTWDIQVDPHALFTAGGVFTHNTRGISARILCLDECQDYLGSEIPVIMECTSHFLDARTLISGTPKSFDNPIEQYWQTTTQNEWMVKCRHCSKWNFLDERNIAATELYTSGKLPPGPVCKRCQKPIYPHLDGHWVSFKKGEAIQGYRVPQLMVPWICGLYEQWIKLLWKRDNYPFSQLYNEVLGLSYDSASKPITREELIERCRDYSFWDPSNLTPILQQAKRYQLSAGVDWGEGNDGAEKTPSGKIRNASYTVLTIGGYVNQKVWRPMLMKRYMGKEVDPDYIVKDVARIANALGVTLVGVDWGHGWGVNNHLIRLLGPKRVVQYQHLPKLKQKMKWDTIGSRYHLHRNFFMSELFFDMKQGFVEFPRWKEFEPFAKDILAIFSEYSEARREMRFDHKAADPDDGFHSILYAKLTSDVLAGKSRKYTFDIEGGIGSRAL